MKLPLVIATIALAAGLPLPAAAQAGATPAQPVKPPSPPPPPPVVAPRITPPLVPPRPPTADPPALQGGKPAPYSDAARRCQALSDIQQRNQCLDRAVRDAPLRSTH